MSTTPEDKPTPGSPTPTSVERGEATKTTTTPARTTPPPGEQLELADYGIDASAGPPEQLDHKGRRPLRLGTREETVALLAMYCSMFLAGWNDATIGPLLLRMQSHYQVSYTIVSLIFVFNFVGFMTAALINVWATTKFGFGVVICFGSALQAFAYCFQSWGPPFPLFCVAQVFNGAGLGLQDAQANTFVAHLPNMHAKMSILHAIYGVGALVCPLVSTQFAAMPDAWHYHYLISLGLALFTFAMLALVFRFRSEESLLGRHADEIPETLETGSGDVATAAEPARPPTLIDILKSRLVHLYAFWIMIYVGLEVTIGGWIVTYIVEVRGGGPSAGYTSSGFFGGLTLGRIIFIPLSKRLGENLAIYVYTFAALALEMVVWFVPNLIGNAVAVSFVGVFLGPHYPLLIAACTKLLPRSHAGGAIGWIASFGQCGSAIFPFIVGAIAQKHGLEAMNPVVTAMIGLLIVIWALTPRVPKKSD